MLNLPKGNSFSFLPGYFYRPWITEQPSLSFTPIGTRMRRKPFPKILLQQDLSIMLINNPSFPHTLRSCNLGLILWISSYMNSKHRSEDSPCGIVSNKQRPETTRVFFANQTKHGLHVHTVNTMQPWKRKQQHKIFSKYSVRENSQV